MYTMQILANNVVICGQYSIVSSPPTFIDLCFTGECVSHR